MDSIFDTEIRPHLRPGLREEAERRAREAAPHYLWFFIDEGKKTGLCSACGNSGIRKSAGSALAMYQEARDYLATERQGAGLWAAPWPDLQRGYASHHLDGSWTHLRFGTCPICGAMVQYRSAAVSRRYLNDTVILAHYAPSSCDTDTVVMTLWRYRIGWAAWQPEYMRVPDEDMELMEVCLMQRGTAGRRYIKAERWCADLAPGGSRAENFRRTIRWERKKECKSGFSPGEERTSFAVSRTMWATDTASMEDALPPPILDTCRALMRAGRGVTAHYYDKISLVNSALRYPCLEYLVKMGFLELAAMIPDRRAGRLLNLRGKDACGVLKIDSNTLGWVKGTRQRLDDTLLELLQTRDRLGLKLGNDVIAGLRTAGGSILKKMADLLPAGLREKAIRYMVRRRIPHWDYLDHLELLQKLDMQPTDDVLTPKDFPEMHARLSQRIKVQSDREKQKALQKRVGRLGAYWFSALGWTIRPMLSAEEVVREGTALRHCVGSNVERYAAGGTILLCLRADNALDTPLYTVEYSTAGKRVQVRGYKNGMQEGWRNGVRMADEEKLELFWRLFDAYRLDWKRAQDQKKQKGRAAA